MAFRILYERPNERFAYLERDGAELMLEQPFTQDRLWPKAELVWPFGRGVNFEIHVNDIAIPYVAVCDAGLTLFLPLEEKWYGRDADEIGVRQFAD